MEPTAQLSQHSALHPWLGMCCSKCAQCLQHGSMQMTANASLQALTCHREGCPETCSSPSSFFLSEYSAHHLNVHKVWHLAS